MSITPSLTSSLTPSLSPNVFKNDQKMKPIDILKRLHLLAKNQDQETFDLFRKLKWFTDNNGNLLTGKKPGLSVDQFQKLDMANALSFSEFENRVKINADEYAPVEMMLFTLEGCPYCEMLVDDEESIKRRNGQERPLNETNGPVGEFEIKVKHDFRFRHLQITRKTPDDTYEVKKNMAIQAWKAGSSDDGPRFPFLRVISKTGEISEPQLWDSDPNFARTARGFETMFSQQVFGQQN